MSHKTMIDGTAYEISGGKTLIDGTSYSIKNGKTLVGGTAYEVGFVKAVSAEGEVLDDWATIASGANVANYSIGNWKLITLTDGTEIVMEIAAFNTDTKTDDSTAAITWISKYVIKTHVMNSTSTCSNGWPASAMRTWLQGDFYNTLPSDVRSVIRTVKKFSYYNSTSLESEDSVWIPSYREVWSSSRWETDGAMYTEYFNRIGEFPIKCDTSGTGIKWWLRSARGSTQFNSISAGGGIVWDNANVSSGVVIGFCT